MVIAAKPVCSTRKLRPGWRARTRVPAGLLKSNTRTFLHERSYTMPVFEPDPDHDDYGDEDHELHGQRADSSRPAASRADLDGKDLDNKVSPAFAGADDNFGLTPRPKVQAQRADPLLGIDLGGVKIMKLIGEGGMGRVYEAQQDKPARTVAVKIIRAGITSEKTLRRFEREAEFLGKLQHPGIAQIFIVGSYASDLGDVPFYVMELVPDAKPITNFAHDNSLKLADKLRLFKLVCEAVSHGHDRSIVHRDLKPGNILVDASGSPKVIDFGVARSTDSDLALEAMKTTSGQMIGTVQYMAPEQFGPNPDDLNSRTDVYALGVVLYELVSGVPPYSVSKRALHEASRVVCEKVPVPLRALDKSIPREISAICERCLQKSPRHRYYSAGELAADIGRFLGGEPVRARSQPAGFDNIIRPVFSRRGLLAIAGASAGVGMLGWTFRDSLPDFETRAPQRASISVSPDWAETSLPVTEGRCYRLDLSGELTDPDEGTTFGPDGTAAREYRAMLGPPPDLVGNISRQQFVRGLPRQIVLARVSSRNLEMAVGSGLTFIAPATGTLAFRVNEQGRDKSASGQLEITLTREPEPQFVDETGATSIRTRVGETDYLLFRPDGLQWEYTTLLKVVDWDYPTLINGIAWWPERDPYDAVRSKVLKTRAFAWAASKTAPQPIVTSVPENPPSSVIAVEGPSPDKPGLMFSDPEKGDSELGCTLRRP